MIDDLETYAFAADDGWRTQLRDPSRPVYSYNMLCAKARHDKWKQDGQDIPMRHQLYRPVPWVHQYDMECWIVFNYMELWQEEILTLQHLVDKATDTALREKATLRLAAVKEFGPTLLPREEHLLRANEIRWPTVRNSDGRWEGVAKRHEWVERIYRNALSPSWKSVPVVGVFGGASQGKTTMASAFMLHVFSHFEGTREGAQCMISTINADKMDTGAWAGVQRMLQSSAQGISLYAGHEQERAGWEIGRKEVVDGVRCESHDKSSSFVRGVLMSVNGKRKELTDKLTGAHRKEAKVLLIDEAQSSADAPFMAISNAFVSVPKGRQFFFFSGNFGEKTDTMGRNIRPVDGWDSIPRLTPEYDAKTQTGLPVRVCYLNNFESPGMTDPDMYHDLFTPDKMQAAMPDKEAEFSSANIRMVEGWYDTPTSTDMDVLRSEVRVMDESDMRAYGAMDPVEIDAATRQVWVTLDTAPEMRDRNVYARWEYGWHQTSNIFQPQVFAEMPAMERGPKTAAEYPETFTRWVKHQTEAAGLNPSEVVNVIDAANYAIFAPWFEQHKMPLQRMVYGANPGNPNGGKADGYGAMEPAFVVDQNNTYGYYTARDRISLGAWLTRQYVANRKIRGLDPERIKANSITMFKADMEIYSRTMYLVRDANRGRLWKLGQKAISDDGVTISPDWLDLVFMASYYATQMFGETPDGPSFRVEIAGQEKEVRMDNFSQYQVRDPLLDDVDLLLCGV